MGNKTVIAVCGKGGVGKTVVSGSLVRILIEHGKSVLAVDADPAMGLAYLLGLPADMKTLGNVKDELIARGRLDRNPDKLVNMVDYLLLEALYELDKFSFLGMGRSLERGCFCPLNTLLKASIEKLARNYEVLVVDAEAGLEQLNRQVMSSVDSIVAVVDNSRRSEVSVGIIMQMVKDSGMAARVGIVKNRWKDLKGAEHSFASTSGTAVWGVIPEDDEWLQNDACGRSVFDLPTDSPVLESVRKILGFII